MSATVIDVDAVFGRVQQPSFDDVSPHESATAFTSTAATTVATVNDNVFMSPSNELMANDAGVTHALRGKVALQRSNSRKRLVDMSRETKNRKVQTYYDTQAESIERIEEWAKLVKTSISYKGRSVSSTSTPGITSEEGEKQGEEEKNENAEEERAQGRRPIRACDRVLMWLRDPVYISLIMNVLLLAGKVVAASLSGSLAVISSVIDSAVDLFASVALWAADRASDGNPNPYFPVGRRRYEPIAIVVTAAVMATASLNIIIRGIEDLTAESHPVVTMDAATLALLIVTIVVKIILYAYCRTFKGNASAHALAMDHLNDSFSNSMALITLIISVYAWMHADAVGAIVISVYIIYTWCREGREHIMTLVGIAASPEHHNIVTYLALHHDPRIVAVDTVRVYHLGVGFFVECDIVLPPDMLLENAHDIGESLQKAIELLPLVDRAYVHLDHEYDHDPSTEHKQL